MQYKGKDDKHVAWVAAAKDVFTALRDYCKKHHTTGPQWNAKGGDVAQFGGGAAPAAGARAGGWGRGVGAPALLHPVADSGPQLGFSLALR